jgi:hypothetical protein
MKCERFLQCLDSYLDESLSELEREAMREHMETCAQCKEIYEEQKALLDAVGSLDEGVHAPEGLVEGAMARIHKERSPFRRRGPWVLGGIAAALCVMVGLAALAGGLNAQMNGAASPREAPMGLYAAGGGMDGGAPSSDTAPEPMPSMAPENGLFTSDVTSDAAAPQQSQAEYEESGMQSSGAESKTAEEYGLKIIREARLELQTENYDQDKAALTALVESFGGHITSSEESGSAKLMEQGGGDRYVSMTLRVPSDRLDAFLEEAKTVGIPMVSSISEQDVTAQYTDTDRRLKAYQKQYDRVLAMMDKAASVEELIQIESELSRLELLIEENQGTLNYWDGRVNYSTVYVYLDEVRRVTPADPTLGQRLQNALETSWEDFKEGARDLLVNVYGGIPYIVTWIVILGVAALITVLIVRRARKRRHNP